MRKPSRAPVLAALIVGLVCAAKGQDGGDPRSRNRLLESELAIARAGGSYMVMDIPGKTISLKARGMVLKSWDIGTSRFWGKRIPMKKLKLKLKSALKPPQRANITPGKEQDPPAKEASPAKTFSESDLGILELKDMPVHYDLVFDDEIRVAVKPRGQKLGTRLTNLGKALGRAIGLPVKTFFRALGRRPFTEISISLRSEKDAREIYWAFLDGHNTIIIP